MGRRRSDRSVRDLAHASNRSEGRRSGLTRKSSRANYQRGDSSMHEDFQEKVVMFACDASVVLNVTRKRCALSCLATTFHEIRLNTQLRYRLGRGSGGSRQSTVRTFLYGSVRDSDHRNPPSRGDCATQTQKEQTGSPSAGEVGVSGARFQNVDRHQFLTRAPKASLPLSVGLVKRCLLCRVTVRYTFGYLIGTVSYTPRGAWRGEKLIPGSTVGTCRPCGRS